MEDENTPKRPVAKRANLASPFSAVSPDLRKPLKTRCLNEGDDNLEATLVESSYLNESTASVGVSLLKTTTDAVDVCNEYEKDKTISDTEEPDEKDNTFSGDSIEVNQKDLGVSLANELGSVDLDLNKTSPNTAEKQKTEEVTTAEISVTFVTANDALSHVSGLATPNDTISSEADAIISASPPHVDSIVHNDSFSHFDAVENVLVHKNEHSFVPDGDAHKEKAVGGTSLADELSCVYTETPRRSPFINESALSEQQTSAEEKKEPFLDDTEAPTSEEAISYSVKCSVKKGTDSLVEDVAGGTLLTDELTEVSTPLKVSAEKDCFTIKNTPGQDIPPGGSLMDELVGFDAVQSSFHSVSLYGTDESYNVLGEDTDKEYTDSALSPQEDKILVALEEKAASCANLEEVCGSGEAVTDVVESSENLSVDIQNTKEENNDITITDVEFTDAQVSNESDVTENTNKYFLIGLEKDETIDLADSPMEIPTPETSQKKRYIPSPIYSTEEDEESDSLKPLPVFNTTVSPSRSAPRFSDSLIEFVMLENNIDREQAGVPPSNDLEQQLLKARLDELEKALASTEQQLDAETKARDLAEKERSDYQFLFEDQAQKNKYRVQMLNERIMALENELEEAKEGGEQQESLKRIGELETDLERINTELEMAQKRGAELQAMAAEGVAFHSSQFLEKQEAVAKLELLLNGKEEALAQAEMRLQETRLLSEETAAKASDLQVLVESNEEEKAQLESNLAVLNQKIASLASHCEAFDKEREEDAVLKESLEKEIAEEKSTVEDLREQLTSICQEREKSVALNEALEKELAEQKVLIEELSSTLTNTCQEKEEGSALKESIEKAFAEEKAMVEGLRSQLVLFKQEKEDIASSKETLERELAAEKVLVSELQSQMATFAQEPEFGDNVIKHDLDELKEALENEKHDAYTWKLMLEGAEADLQKEKEAFASLQKQLDEISKEKEVGVQKADAVTKDLEATNALIDELRQQLRNVTDEKEREVDSISEALASERAAYKTEMDQLQAEVNRLSAVREELKTTKLRCVELSASNKVLEKKTDELVSVKEELEQANEAAAELRVELRVIDADREVNAAKVKQMEKEVAKKAKEATDSVAALVALNTENAMRMAEKDIQIEELKQRSSEEFEVRVNDLTVQLSSKDAELDELRSKLAAAQTRIEWADSLQSEVHKLTAEADEKYALLENTRQIVSEKEAEVRQLKELLSASNEHKARIEVLTAELDSKTSELVQLTAKVDSVEAESANLTTEITRLKAANDDLEKEVRERRRSAVNVLAPVKSAEMDEMKKRVAELEEQLQKSKRECDRYLTMCDEFDDIENDLKRTIAEKNAEILRLKIKAGEEKTPVLLLDTLKQGVEAMPPGSVENSPVANKTLAATSMRVSPAATPIAHTSVQNAEKSQCKQQ